MQMFRERVNDTLQDMSEEQEQIKLTKSGLPLQAADFDLEFKRLNADFVNKQNER